MSLGRFITNVPDPNLPGAKGKFVYELFAIESDKQAIEKQWKVYSDWLKQHEIGPPQAIEHYSADELKEMGMCGIYDKN